MTTPHSWPLNFVYSYVDSSGHEDVSLKIQRKLKIQFRSIKKSWLRLKIKASRVLCDTPLKECRERSYKGKAREGHHEGAEIAVSLSQVIVCMLKTPHRYCGSRKQGALYLKFQGMV